MCERSGWPDNSSYNESGSMVLEPERVASPGRCESLKNQSQARIHLPWNDLAARTWQLLDVMSGDVFQRDGDEMNKSGLYVDLPAWRFSFVKIQT